MSTDQIALEQAIQNARRAMRHGEHLDARRWAENALRLAPQCEEAWLILGAMASPRASLAYFEQALKINPLSQLGRQGMVWAQKRLTAARNRASRLTGPMHKRISTADGVLGRRRTSLPILLMTLACLLAAWTVWPGNSAYALPILSPNASGSAGPQPWSELDVARPTYTATATLVPTATPLPSPTPTAVPTETQIPTDLPTATAETAPTTVAPVPVTAGSTYIVRPGDTLFSIAQRAGLEASLLAAVNNIPDGRTIYVGQALIIPNGAIVADPTAPPAASSGKYILVDISEQHLYAYEGDTLVFSFVASTGMNNATRTGTFHVLDKIPNAYGATWNIWMPNWLGIYYAGSLENGIHALPILPNGSRLWAGYLGTPISYGCVVLGVQESQMLYDWAEVGTVVQIRR